MSTNKYFDRICVIVIALALIVTVLFMNGDKLGIQTIVDADSDTHEEEQYFTKNDLYGEWDVSKAEKITLSDAGKGEAGSGAYYEDGNLVIAKSGYYALSGSLS